VALLLSGCGTPHSQPQKDSENVMPNEVLEFGQLISENCAGYHGEDGRGGAPIALADPLYLAVAADRTIFATLLPTACAEPRCPRSP